ncbi:MAG: fibronectin type III domain-containing protein [Patescibacteria group bacterium]|nr:fibronectin type III domain-containing protein [Patescibacteria group bacterium]
MNIFKYKISVLLIIFVLLLPNIGVKAADELIITNMKAEPLTNGNVKISWNTDSNATGIIEYGLGSWNLNAYVESNQSKRYHEVVLGNLLSDTTYYYQITAKNNSGQSVSFVQSFKVDVFKNKTAPNITNATVDYVAGTVAVVSWQTDEPATTYLEYGKYESYTKSIHESSRADSHRVIIKNLQTNTKYSVRFNSTDKDGNRSSTHMRSFTTYSSSNIDNEALIIKKFNPNSANDPGISDTEITVKFTTNHWAKARVTLSAPGKKNQTAQLDYETNHELEFDNLSPSTDYKVKINLTDVYGKTLSEEYMVKTKVVNNESSLEATNSRALTSENVNTSAAYAKVVISEYKNSGSGDVSDKVFLGSASKYIQSGDWFLLYENGEHVLDQDIDGIDNVPGIMIQRKEGKIKLMLYKAGSSDDMSAVVGYIEFFNAKTKSQAGDKSNKLEKGNDKIWIEDNRSYFSLRTTRLNDAFLTSWDIEQGLGVVTGTGAVGSGLTSGSSVVSIYNGDSNDQASSNVSVLGSEHSHYAQASALVKTKDVPDVYAVINGMCHYISSPQSFNEYGYQWDDVKIISEKEMEACPRARLLKSPDRPTIYYLYQRPQDKWLKIDILSPTVFVSYPDNYWGNVITVNDFDINSYPDVKLIKTYDKQEIYFVRNNVKHYVSDEVFKAKGFNPYEVVTASQAHFLGYKEGEDLK